MAMYDVTGACDMHIHTGPDFVERVGDDIEVAQACEQAGFRAILLKSHMESTVSRAYHAQKYCQQLRVYGALVLGASVGGINPFAAEAAMKAGAKEVFMPTFCSAADAAIHHKTGDPRLYKYGLKTPVQPISVTDSHGTLIPEAKAILELSRDYGVAVGTSHLSYCEIKALCIFGHDIGARLVITHPEYKVPMLNKEQVAELVKYGAVVELTAGAVFPIPGCSTVMKDREMIDYVGADHFFISSDCGTPTKPMPAATLSSYLYCLQKMGLDKAVLDYMIREKPAEVFEL